MADVDKQVTWGGRFSKQPDMLMQIFGESVSFDKRLAPFDLRGSLGHASMLAHVGVLSQELLVLRDRGVELRLAAVVLARGGNAGRILAGAEVQIGEAAQRFLV